MPDMGPIPAAPLDDSDTDPEPFGSAKEQNSAATVKRCMHCGQEIEADAFKRGAFYALNCVYWWLRKAPHLGESAAVALVSKIRDELGF